MSEDGRSWAERGLPPELDPRRPARSRSAARSARRDEPAARAHTVTPATQSSRGRTVLKVLSLGTAALLLVVGLGAYGLYRHFDGNLTRANVFGLLGNRPDKVAGGALNLLLVGSDSRAGADAQYQGGTAAEVVSGARSDTTILAHISADRQHAVLMSIPRDLLVPAPACTGANGKTLPARTSLQFNAAFSEGGAPCTIATVEMLTSIRIDHYVEVDFAGFKQMVSALGGVPICLPTAVKDTKDTVDLPAGQQTLTGDQALGFVRARYGIGDGSDLSRIDRQKEFLGAMVRRVTSAGTLLRPDRLLSFLDAASRSVKVDENLSVGDMRTIAQSLGGLDPQRVTFVTLPLNPDPGPDFRPGGRYYGRVKADPVAAEALFTALRTDSGLPGQQAPVATTGPLTVPPAKVTVEVLNASGKQGAASAAAGTLRQAGFRTSSVGNAPAGSKNQTAVRYGAGEAEAARTLGAALGVAPQADSSVKGVRLLVGSDLVATLKPVTVASAAPAASAAATPSGVAVKTTNAGQTACS